MTQERATVPVRRVYDGEPDEERHSVLVDRIWPRGLRKADAPWQEWLKDVAPTTELRRWYGHEPSRFAEFASRYRAELAQPPASLALAHLTDLARGGRLTLVTATRDVEHSAAKVLQQQLERALRAGRGAAGRERSGADEG
jgi:uncharacterized protein YeaO (DUF488 family)